jgi:hypothetical protein
MEARLWLLGGVVMMGFAAQSLIEGDVHGALVPIGIGLIGLSQWREEAQKAESESSPGFSAADGDRRRGGNLLLLGGLALFWASALWGHEWVWVYVGGAITLSLALAIVWFRVRTPSS